MKFGIRTPSLRKRIAARTSPARFLRHSLGLKAPRGWGWVTNPKRAAYNRIYNRTTTGCLLPVLVLLLVALLSAWAVAGETKYYDAKGRYVGKKDAAGKVYDRRMQFRGQKDAQGRVYTPQWQYRGQETQKK